MACFVAGSPVRLRCSSSRSYSSTRSCRLPSSLAARGSAPWYVWTAARPSLRSDAKQGGRAGKDPPLGAISLAVTIATFDAVLDAMRAPRPLAAALGLARATGLARVPDSVLLRRVAVRARASGGIALREQPRDGHLAGSRLGRRGRLGPGRWRRRQLRCQRGRAWRSRERRRRQHRRCIVARGGPWRRWTRRWTRRRASRRASHRFGRRLPAAAAARASRTAPTVDHLSRRDPGLSRPAGRRRRLAPYRARPPRSSNEHGSRACGAKTFRGSAGDVTGRVGDWSRSFHEHDAAGPEPVTRREGSRMPFERNG